MLEHARKEIRPLIGLLEKKKRTIVYTDFQGTLGEIVERDMPALLYEPPFTDYAPQGPDQVFAPDLTMRLVDRIRAVSDSAEARPA